MRIIHLLIAGTFFCTASVTATTRFIDALFSDVDVTSGVEYRTAANHAGTDVNLLMDIYEPQGDTMSSRPVVVVMHGGAFAEGVGGRDDAFSAATAAYLASKGFVTASIEYRTGYALSLTAAAAEVKKAAYRALQDAKAAVRFLKANATTYRIDPEAVFLCGYSAGAIMALNYSHLTETKFLSHQDTAGLGALETGDNLTIPSSVKGSIGFAGAVLDTTWLTAGAAPSICFHGTEDEVVPYESGYAFGVQIMPYLYGSSAIRRVSERIGYVNKLITYEGETHTFVSSASLLTASLDSAAVFIYALYGTSAVRTPFIASGIRAGTHQKHKNIGLFDLAGRYAGSRKTSRSVYINYSRTSRKVLDKSVNLEAR